MAILLEILRGIRGKKQPGFVMDIIYEEGVRDEIFGVRKRTH